MENSQKGREALEPLQSDRRIELGRVRILKVRVNGSPESNCFRTHKRPIHHATASYWEIAIKISLGKYSLPEPYEAFMNRQIEANDFRILHIEPKHTAAVSTMPFHHRDPFDRLIVAQATVEQIAVVSIDSALDAYGITRLW